MSEMLPNSYTPLPILPRRHVQIINVLSRKGGVGKTTMALLIARHLAERDEKPVVVVFDLDFTGTSLEDAIQALTSNDSGAEDEEKSEPQGLEEYLFDLSGGSGWELQAEKTLGEYRVTPSAKPLFYYASSANQRQLGDPADERRENAADKEKNEDAILGNVKAKEIVRERLHRLIRWVIERNGDRRHFVFILDNSPGVRGLGKELLDHAFHPRPPPRVTWADVIVATPDRQDLLASFHVWLDAYRRKEEAAFAEGASPAEVSRRASENLLFLVNKLDKKDGNVRRLLRDVLPRGIRNREYDRLEIQSLIDSGKVEVAHCSFADGLARLFRGLEQAEIPPIEKYVPQLHEFLEKVDPVPPKSYAIPKGPRPDFSETFTRGGETIALKPLPDAIAIGAIVHPRWPRAPFRAQLERDGYYRTSGLASPQVEVYELPRGKDAAAIVGAYRARDDLRFANRVYQHDPGDSEDVLVMTDRVAVQFDPDMPLERVQKKAHEHGLLLVQQLDRIPNGYVAVVRRRYEKDALQIANELLYKKLAVEAEPVWVRSMVSTSLISKQWHLSNDGTNGKAGADANVLKAWELGATGNGISIAIIEPGGIDISHAQLDLPGKLVPSYDAEYDEGDASPLYWTETHGTNVAGVALAARITAEVAAGAAPEARLIPVRAGYKVDRAGDMVEELAYYRAFRYARLQGADVVSCSWGVPGQKVVDQIPPFYVRNEFRLLTQEGRGGKGTPIFFAAGNDNENMSNNRWASNPNVIAIAASTDSDKKAGYSNFGESIWVCAPGGPRGITTIASGGGHTDDFAGTSAACPLAAAVAALMLSMRPDLTLPDIKSILRETAVKIDGTGSFVDRTEASYETKYVAGRSLAYGYGRIDAAEAVRRAKTWP